MSAAATPSRTTRDVGHNQTTPTPCPRLREILNVGKHTLSWRQTGIRPINIQFDLWNGVEAQGNAVTRLRLSLWGLTAGLDDMLPCLRRLRSLEALHLDDNQKLHGNLTAVSNFPSLLTLQLNNTKVSGSVVCRDQSGEKIHASEYPGFRNHAKREKDYIRFSCKTTPLSAFVWG